MSARIYRGVGKGETKGNLFGVVKRMSSRKKDVVGGGGVKDKEGKVQVEN